MNRREFVKSMAAVGALAITGCGSGSREQYVHTGTSDPTASPNILLMLVDEMRYPVHFPEGVDNADEFLARFMPNLFRHMWRDGVKFNNYRVAAGACTPSRSVLLTGLYTQQTWVLTTISGAGVGGDLPPSLSPDMPTYGSLLKQVGYETPYFGKFHVAADIPYTNDDCTDSTGNYLEPWGFEEYVCPDPGGSQGQGNSGDGKLVGDKEIADAAVSWFSTRKTTDGPFCATVSFVNPHDYQYFWGGTEPQTYLDLFTEGGQTPLVSYDTSIESESNPPAQGFPSVPSNWESFDQIQANKPRAQAMFNQVNQCLFGSASFDPEAGDFALEQTPVAAGQVYKGVAPHSYWQRGADSYAQVLGNVDQQIGRVLEAIPPEVLANTVIVFSSDHGEYCGSHGLLAGKVGTVYEEALRVPLVVRDHTGRFADTSTLEREQLTSSVDLVRMLVTLGHNGSRDWLQGEMAELYGNRHDLLGVVESNSAAGRDYAVYTSDEFVNRVLNYSASPTHIAGLVTGAHKLGFYRYWAPRSTRPLSEGQELEFYDHATPGGAAETLNLPDDPRAQELLERWDSDILPNEVRKPLPASLQAAQEATRQTYLAFSEVLDDLNPEDIRSNLAFNMGLDRI